MGETNRSDRPPLSVVLRRDRPFRKAAIEQKTTIPIIITNHHPLPQSM